MTEQPPVFGLYESEEHNHIIVDSNMAAITLL